MVADHINNGNADNEVEFAINIAAMLRTAARAVDEFGVSARELARRFAEQVDADPLSTAQLGHPGQITNPSRRLSQLADAPTASVGCQLRPVRDLVHAMKPIPNAPVVPWRSRLAPPATRRKLWKSQLGCPSVTHGHSDNSC